MSSIDSKDIIRTILKNGGQYPGDPPSFSIWQYQNMFGGSTFKLCGDQAQENNFLDNGMYKGRPEVLFRHGEVTAAGNDLLGETILNEGSADGESQHSG